jgi:hypothetical protein
MDHETRLEENRQLMARLIVVAGLLISLATMGPCCAGESRGYCLGTGISAVDCCGQSIVQNSTSTAALVDAMLAPPPTGRLLSIPPPTAPGPRCGLSLPTLRRAPASTVLRI